MENAATVPLEGDTACALKRCTTVHAHEIYITVTANL